MVNTLVIIPSYNEEKNIIQLIDKIFSLNLNLDILVVDDGSDSAERLIKEKQADRTDLYFIKRTGKLGRGSAVLEGLEFGLKKDYKFFVEMDADFSHQPEELPRLLGIAKPNTVVIGSRYVKGSKIEGWPLKRRIFSKLANFYAEMVLGIGISDYTNGFRVYGRDAAEKIDFKKIKSAGYIVLSEIAYQLFKKGIRFFEVDTIFVNRDKGRSNFSLKEIKESFVSVLKIRFRGIDYKNIFLLTLLGVVGFFSFYHLKESPPIWHDEGIFIQAAANLVKYGELGVQLEPGNIDSAIFITSGYTFLYPIGLVFKYFGVGVLQARIVMAVFLILTVLFSYFLVRNLFGSRLAVFSSLILASFPLMYGNGKTVLGEVPGLFFLFLSLFFLGRAEKRDFKNKKDYILSGLILGLCLATKPIFLLLLPPIAAVVLLNYKVFLKNKIAFFIFLFALSLPLAAGLVLQHASAPVPLGKIFSFYINPSDVNMAGAITENLARFVKESTPLYLLIFFSLWSAAVLLRYFKKIKISVSEQVSFFFTILIVLAYLRTAGWYRYFFTALALSLVFLPSSIHTLFDSLKKYFSFLNKVKFLPACFLVLLAGFQFYLLCFDSWAASYYASNRTKNLEEYFAIHNFENVFIYDAPEIVPFLSTDKYYQYVVYTPALSGGESQINKIFLGLPQFILTHNTTYNDRKDNFNLYVIKDNIDRYAVLIKSEE